MPTYTYEIIDSEGKSTEVFIERVQSIKDNSLTEILDEKTGVVSKVRRVITGGCGTIFKGGGWTVSAGSRGYQGKYKDKLRPVGTPVDAPTNKSEADRQFDKWISSGGLDGIEPSMKFGTQTTEQQLDKKYNPYK